MKIHLFFERCMSKKLYFLIIQIENYAYVDKKRRNAIAFLILRWACLPNRSKKNILYKK